MDLGWMEAPKHTAKSQGAKWFKPQFGHEESDDGTRIGDEGSQGTCLDEEPHELELRSAAAPRGAGDMGGIEL